MHEWIRYLLIIAVAGLLLGGCSSSPTLSDGQPGIQLFPDIQECEGRMSGSFSVSGTSFGAAAATGTFSADCGDGFKLIHAEKGVVGE